MLITYINLKITKGEGVTRFLIDLANGFVTIRAAFDFI